jgi:hypothetical protein
MKSFVRSRRFRFLNLDSPAIDGLAIEFTRSIHSHWRNTGRPSIPAGQKAIPQMRSCWAKWSGKIPSFRAWVPGDAPTRTLQLLTEGRRRLVEDMTALTNQLTSVLKTYYPQALEWAGHLGSEQACAFLEKWPTLMELQKSRPFRIREFYQKHGRPSREVLNERVDQIQKGQPLTLDEAGVMMVPALVAQIRPLRLAIENYDQEIERVFR